MLPAKILLTEVISSLRNVIGPAVKDPMPSRRPTWQQRPLGQKADRELILKETRQDFRWGDSGPIQTLLGGDIELIFEGGETRKVSSVVHSPRWHLKGGGYGGYRGWNQGDNQGEYYCEHETWDLSDPAISKEASTLNDHLIEWYCGNDTGFGIMEYGVGPGYYKYKNIQHLPTF
jgi:hypothetical protein